MLPFSKTCLECKFRPSVKLTLQQCLFLSIADNMILFSLYLCCVAGVASCIS